MAIDIQAKQEEIAVIQSKLQRLDHLLGVVDSKLTVGEDVIEYSAEQKTTIKDKYVELVTELKVLVAAL